MKKRVLSIILTVCMVLTLLPTITLAADGSNQSFTVTGGTLETDYTYASGVLTVLSSTAITIKNTDPNTYTTDRIVVSSGVTANITLSGVKIDLSGVNPTSQEDPAVCPFNMTGATVNLTLSGENVLKSGMYAAGLQVPDGASLIITKASTGSLESIAKYKEATYPGAGIGGSRNQAGGAVTINGGTVIATGGGGNAGPSGAGIGGGGAQGYGKSGGTITINGGTVTATGMENSAGIGGGGAVSSGGSGGTITITGGTVIANGGSWRGAGIGGGGSNGGGDGATVVITGGSVKAVAGGGAAEAIGHGDPGGNHGTLKNDTGADVTLYTLTLPGAICTAVTALTTTPTLDKPYGTTDMKTDANGKLYLYLPAGKTAVKVTTAAGTYTGNIAGGAVTLSCVGYPISGTVNAGTTGASVSGLTVNLYASSDASFSNSVGSTTTDSSGAYVINDVPNGSYVARVASAPGSYVASASGTITVNSGAVSGTNITLSREAYSGDVASTPILISKTDTQVALGAVTVAGQTVEYGKNTSDNAPTEWQDGTTFTGLTENKTYYFFARVKQAGAVEAGGVSSALTVTTKTSPTTLSDSGVTYSVKDGTITGLESTYEYSLDNGVTWKTTPVTGVTFTAGNVIQVRTRETNDDMPSQPQTLGTIGALAEAPTYAIDFINEKTTVSVPATVEYNTTSSDAATWTAGPGAALTLTPGTTYYFRVVATDSALAGNVQTLVIPARPAVPDVSVVSIAAGNDSSHTAITLANTYEYILANALPDISAPGTAGTGSASEIAATEGQHVYIRVKAANTSFAGAWKDCGEVQLGVNSINLVSVGYDVAAGTLTGTTTNMQYSLDGAAWQDCTADNTTGLTFVAGTVKVRQKDKPTNEHTVGTIAAPAEAPIYAIDFINEKTTVSFPATVEYNMTSATATTWTAGQGTTLTLTPGTTYYFRVAATDSALAGNVQTLSVPARPAMPDVSVVTIAAGNDSSHTVITLADTYEYILADALPDISMSGTVGTGSASEITAIGGQHVYIRVKAVASTSFASAWTDCGEVQLGVNDINLTAVGYDVAAGTLTGTTTNMQYSLDGGVTWQDCATGNTTGLTFIAGTVKVRQKDKPTNEHIVGTIAPVESSTHPTLGSKTYNSVTLTAMSGYEYSKDGGATWQDSNVFSGLSGSTDYSFVARIKATATTLPGTVSAALAVTTDSAPSGGSGNSSASTGAPVIVDGKTENIGTENKTGDATTVTVDQSKLGENINGAATGSSVVVPVSENSAATASLVVKNIEDMAQKGMTLTVQTGSVAYNLNTSAIDTAALTAAFPGADMSEVPFDVTIKNSSVSVEGETLVLNPVTFTVTATYNGKTVSVDTFSAYINRMIEVTPKQAAKITTAVVVNADGSTRHVPTNVVEKDGKYYAIINSRTNSTYALIQNEVTFADAKGKWYEGMVNEMGSRKIIAGLSASVFGGGASITRAEFAAILVRALGLPTDGTSSFSDVHTTAWYTGAVATAVQYGLASGTGENRFSPNAAITRQEAMLMLKRAAALTEFSGTSGTLDGFTDVDAVSSWAKDAAKWNVGSGLIKGSDGKLNPTAKITRAESATIILRLLQKAGLVDVRS